MALVSNVAFANDIPPENGEPTFQVRLSRSRDRFIATQAIRGAHRRLGDAKCRAIFSDFADPSGRTLQQALDEQGQSGQSHLRRLLFYDGADTRACRVKGVLASTQPGSRVIFICSDWFREAFALNPGRVEAVIIHELLHSLGLGENPPSSQHITAQVAERCGG
jgi:hypothetical protein